MHAWTVRAARGKTTVALRLAGWERVHPPPRAAATSVAQRPPGMRCKAAADLAVLRLNPDCPVAIQALLQQQSKEQEQSKGSAGQR